MSGLRAAWRAWRHAGPAWRRARPAFRRGPCSSLGCARRVGAASCRRVPVPRRRALRPAALCRAASQVLAFSLEHERPTLRLGRLAIARLGLDAVPDNPLGAQEGARIEPPAALAACPRSTAGAAPALLPAGARPQAGAASRAPGCQKARAHLRPLPTSIPTHPPHPHPHPHPGRAERKRMTQRRHYWRRRLQDLQKQYPDGIPEEASRAPRLVSQLVFQLTLSFCTRFHPAVPSLVCRPLLCWPVVRLGQLPATPSPPPTPTPRQVW